MKNKRFLSMLLCMALAVSCLAGMTVSASADDVVSYTVKNGDYLYKVCKNNGLDYYTCKSAIMILNGWSTETQCNRIIPGQTIILPVSNAVAATVKSSATSTSSKTESITINGKTYSSSSTSTISTAANSGDSIAYYLVAYTVKSGDYIAKICSNLGTSYTAYKSIINAVNGLTSTKIYAGKVLYIPVSSAPSSGSFYAVMAHRVDTGETMSTICSSYSANASSTITKGVNDGTNLNYLQAGQVVYIPVASSVIVTPTPTSSSSPSGPVTGTYSISFTSVQHGTPFAMVGSSEATGANSGKTVTIVADADDGYAQKSVSVVRTDTKATVPVSDNTFTMPASDVKISVTYAASKTITKTKTTNGSFTTYVNGIEGQTAAYGSRVFLEFSPKAGYTVESVSYVKASGGTAVTVKPDSDGDYYFNMPNYNIKLSVTFAKASYYNITGTAKDENGNVKGTLTYKMDGVALSSTYPKAAKGAKIAVVVSPTSGYGVKSVMVKNGATELDVTKVSDTEYSFKMPEGDAAVTVVMKQTKTYQVVQKKSDGGSVTFFAVRKNTKGTDEQVYTDYFYEGETVYIKPVPNSKKAISGAPVVSVNVGSSVTSTPSTKYTGCYEFTMVGNWVTVIPQWTDSSRETNHIWNSDLWHASYTCYDKDGLLCYDFASGDTVTIKLSFDAGYGINPGASLGKFQIISCKSDGTFEDLSYKAKTGEDYTYTFTMPANGVSIRIIASDSAYVVKTLKVSNYLSIVDADTKEDKTSALSGLKPATVKVMSQELDVSSSNSIDVQVGTTLEIVAANLKDGYTISKVWAYGAQGSQTIKADSNGRYYYTIKDADVDSTKLITFTVQIAASTYEIMYSSPVNGSYTINTFSNSVRAYAGETITIADITPKVIGTPGDPDYKEYEFNKLIVDDADQTVNVSGGSYKFTMPAWDVKTQVTFKEK